MRGKFGLILAAAMLAMAVPPASAKDDKASGLETRSQMVAGEAMGRIRASDPAGALALVEPLIDEFERAYAGKTRIYCADTLEESAIYALAPGSDGGKSIMVAPDGARPESTGTSVIIGSGWCAAQYIRAFALIDLKRVDEAQAGLLRLLEFAPKRARYLNELGFILQNKRQWQASIEVYRRAADAARYGPQSNDEESCVALRGIGYDLVELGKLDEAETVYRKCLAITPGEPKSLGELEYIRRQRRKTV